MKKSLQSCLPVLVLLEVVLCTAPALNAQTPHYHLSGSIAIAGSGGWDYLAADPDHRRLYVSHGDVAVVDLDSQKVIGTVSGMQHVHGIALAPDLGTGFISDGGTNQVFAFDLATLKVKQTIPAGTNPDGIVYDKFSQQVFVFNGRSQNATVINAATFAVAATIPLGGKPEFPVSDGKGNVYDNIESKSEIVRIDVKKLAVSAHWPLAPCESPSGLAFDDHNRRLFSVCDNKLLAVMDADSGKVVSTVPIGEGPDATAFDPLNHLVFSSNGEDGTLTVVKQNSADSYSVADTVTTQKSARTMALDTKSHTVYLSSARFAPGKNGPGQRPSILPGTFKLLIVAP